jgi:hypothetical protein
MYKLIIIFLAASLFIAKNPSESTIQAETENYNEKAKVEKAKKALIIANGIYQPMTKWRNISSHNDIPILKDALKEKGFQEDHIRVEKDLTFDKFNQVFSEFTESLSEGDIVYIHISSHGQQVYDNENKDEADGYDEAIVPVDAPSDYSENNYTGEKHIRDEQLGAMFDAVRRKIGVEGNLFAVLDACHSGTGTRGLVKVRGTSKPLQPANYIPVEPSGTSGDYGLLKSVEDLAPAVYFYGASAHQLNYEYEIEKGNYLGSLSFAIAKALKETNSNTTYQGLFDNINNIMSKIAPKQNPQAEGVLNQKILGGELADSQSYYVVKNYKKTGKGIFVDLNAGKLQGLNVGSKVAFYNIDGLDEAKPKCNGVVVKSEVISSRVKLNTEITKPDALNSWVIVTEKNYGDLKVSVSLKLKQNSLKKELLKAIDTLGFVMLNDNNPDVIIESGTEYSRGNNLQIYTKNDYVYWESDASEIGTLEILEQLEDFARANFIRKLEMDNDELAMDFNFIPVSMQEDEYGDEIVDQELDIDDYTDALGTVVFKEGDHTYINIKNNSFKTLYYTLLDLQPDNKINILIPDRYNTPEDYVLKPGKSYKHLIEFFPPYGTEVFKLIASEEPIDLRPLINNRGKKGDDRIKNENNNPFAIAFSDTYKNIQDGTRGGETKNVPIGAVHIHTVVFKITE